MIFRILVALLMVLSVSVMAQDVRPFQIERSAVVSIESKIINRSYDLYIKLPSDYTDAADSTWPLLFLTDGNYAFPLASSLVRQMSGSNKIQEPIIVGISHAKEDPWQISRTRDFTPTRSLKEANYHSKEARKHSGGAENYQRFLKHELLPWLEKNYRINASQKIFAGHSFGGLLGGTILTLAPDTFDFYIVSDPSFWYHNKSIFSLKHNSSPIKSKTLIVSAAPRQEEGELKMVSNAKQFAESLSPYLGENGSVEVMVFDGEIHETLFPISLSRGLRKFLAK